MKLLIVGNGGREHAIALKVSQSEKVKKIYCAPGNGGTDLLEKCENIAISGIEDLVKFAKGEGIDLTIVGSEELLVGGIVDEFHKNNLKIIGPDKKAAILEGSKVFAKSFMKKYGIKTAEYRTFSDVEKAKSYVLDCKFPIVIKADGLAAGKGVLIVEDKEEALKGLEELMVKNAFDGAGSKIVIEEYLEGVEASILSITDSKRIIPFISAKDHKKIFENETGPNTGGMGAIAPNPYVTEDVNKDFYENILKPTLKGIKEEGMDFSGFIFFGLMITKDGVYLLEYNMRLGDPETQAVLPLLENDFVDVILCAINKNLDKLKLVWKNKSACCVVMSSGGYPKNYQKGYEISGIETLDRKEVLLFVAGAKRDGEKLYTSGGRVLNVVGIGENLETAREKAYENIKKLNFKDSYYRKDI